MSAGKVKLFVFGLVIGSAFLISSCTLPTLGDTGANSPHQEATPKSETSSQTNTSSGEQAYTGVLSLSGAVKILTEKREEYRKANNYRFSSDFTDLLTTQDRQGLSNWLTQEKNAIKPFIPSERDGSAKFFEINIGDNEKYYWIGDDGNQMGTMPDLYSVIPHDGIQFSLFIREGRGKKDVVYVSDQLFYGDSWLPLIEFDTKNQVFEMYSSQKPFQGAFQFEFDRSFNNKRRVNDYSLPSPLEGLNEGYDIKKEPLNVQFFDSVGGDESTIVRFILENSPSLRTSLAKVFSVNENDISKIIESLEKNRAIPTLSHMSKEGELITFELEWLTFTRLKNLGLPQGKHTYTISKKAVIDMILTESSTLKQEFIEDFGENSGKPFGVALWDKGPNGEDLAWFAWGTSLRPLVVDVDHATYSIPTFDLVFPTMDGAKPLKNEFGRDIVELVQDENSTLPYGSANEKKNLGFASIRQKNGKIWEIYFGTNKGYEKSNIDASTFRPLGLNWGKDKNGFTFKSDSDLPNDAILLYDALFYSKNEHKLYGLLANGNWGIIPVVGTKIRGVDQYSPFDSPDSVCTDNNSGLAVSYQAYDEKVCYGSLVRTVGTRK